MKVLLCFLLPPVACLWCNKPIQAIINLLLCITIALIPVAVIHALVIVNGDNTSNEVRKIYKLNKEDR